MEDQIVSKLLQRGFYLEDEHTLVTPCRPLTRDELNLVNMVPPKYSVVPLTSLLVEKHLSEDFTCEKFYIVLPNRVLTVEEQEICASLEDEVSFVDNKGAYISFKNTIEDKHLKVTIKFKKVPYAFNKEAKELEITEFLTIITLVDGKCLIHFNNDIESITYE